MNEQIRLPGLEGKCAVVTGAGGAIGGAISAGLASAGVRVAIWDLSSDAALEKSSAIREAGGQAIAVTCDVTDRGSV